MDAVAEIKARLPIEELVGSYCKLEQKGRTLKAVCPFHNDTHPSLLVSPDKGIAYCFVCQTGGDIFSFYQKVENVDFPQALRDLAERAGVELPKERPNTPKKGEKDRIRECLEKAASFYEEQRKKSAIAMLYVEQRKLTPELLKNFQIGFAPDSFDATYTYLLKENFSRKEILASGLGVQKDLKEERIYDRFRNRIMFPISDPQGKIIGFGGRTLGNEDAKYINSPDGSLYNKSIALFGLSHAKEAIKEKKAVILVEGYFDVVSCHRLGIKNVVAVSGTALTREHVVILKRYAEKILLLLDQDSAGEAAAERAFLLCAAQDLDVASILLPKGKDPDECASLAPEEMKTACTSGGVPYLSRMIQRFQEQGMDKRTMLKRLLPLLQSISSAVERERYVREAAGVLGVTSTALEDDIRSFKESPRGKDPGGKEREIQAPFSSIELFFGLLLTYPAHLSMIEKLIAPEDTAEKALYTGLKALYTPAHPKDPRLSDLSEHCRERATILCLYCEEHFGAWSESMAGKELRKLCQKVNRELLLGKQKQLIGSIKEARALGKKMEEEQLLTQYQQVLKLSAMAS
jgi:DNA primase